MRRAPSQFRCLRHSRSRRTQRPPGAARQQVASPTPALRAGVMDDMVSEGDDSGCFLCRQCGEPIVDHKAMVVSGHLPFHADCYNAKRQLDGAVAASPEFHQRNLRNARAPKKNSEVQARNASSDGKPSSPGGSSMALRAQVFARRSAFSAGFSAHPLAHPSEDENRFCRRSLEPLVV